MTAVTDIPSFIFANTMNNFRNCTSVKKYIISLFNIFTEEAFLPVSPLIVMQIPFLMEIARKSGLTPL